MISIILPIYNVQSYLRKCLDSLFGQYDASLMEVILVNDGSTDGSLGVCKGYQERFPEIIILNKMNGGLSDARNAGMQVATGEYIYFIDSDDWLAPNAIKNLYEFAVANDCEMVQGGFYYAYDDHLLLRKANRKELQKTVLTREEAMRELIINDRVKNFAWGKLYKTDLLRDLEFPVGKYFEDSFWQHLVIDRVTQYGIIDEPLYYYRQRADSISGTPSFRLNDLLEGNRERMSFMHDYYPALFPLMRRRYNALCEQVHSPQRMKSRFKRLMQRIIGRLKPSLYRRIAV